MSGALVLPFPSLLGFSIYMLCYPMLIMDMFVGMHLAKPALGRSAFSSRRSAATF
jgi:hypothetical protein